jgi:hypothetical protein
VKQITTRLQTVILAIIVALLGLVATNAQAQQESRQPYLSDTTFWVSDTSDYTSLRLHVINPGDSLVVIERVQPSCGCVLATTQRNLATRQTPGDIYVAVTTHKLDSLQPITVDVYTNRNRTQPLRLYIRYLPHIIMTLEKSGEYRVFREKRRKQGK